MKLRRSPSTLSSRPLRTWKAWSLAGALIVFVASLGACVVDALDADGDGWLAVADCDDADPTIQQCDLGEPCVTAEMCLTGVCQWGLCAEAPTSGGKDDTPEKLDEETLAVSSANVEPARTAAPSDDDLEDAEELSWDEGDAAESDPTHELPPEDPAAAAHEDLASEAMFVTLTWVTPGDPDPEDEGPYAGADLDLHLQHPLASGVDGDEDGAMDGWFDVPFDCFWINPDPSWGSVDPMVDDDPRLELEDNDGAGPEAISLTEVPYDGGYTIGVHVWSDNGHGGSRATVRLYVYGTLVLKRTASLRDGDLWEVATVAWPEGDVRLVLDEDGRDVIIHDFVQPFAP